MIYPLTNVATTQDVPLDGTIFFSDTGQKDKATFINNNIPIRGKLSLWIPTEIKFYNTV